MNETEAVSFTFNVKQLIVIMRQSQLLTNAKPLLRAVTSCHFISVPE